MMDDQKLGVGIGMFTSEKLTSVILFL